MDNLQPVACPYCGHEMRLYQGIMVDGYCYTRYMCLDCGAMAPMVKESSVEAAIKKAYEVSTGRSNNG